MPSCTNDSDARHHGGLDNDIRRPHGYTWTPHNQTAIFFTGPHISSKEASAPLVASTSVANDVLEAKFAPMIRRYTVNLNNVSRSLLS